MSVKIYNLIFDECGFDKAGRQLYCLSPNTYQYDTFSEQAKKMRKLMGFWRRFFLSWHKDRSKPKDKQHREDDKE